MFGLFRFVILSYALTGALPAFSIAEGDHFPDVKIASLGDNAFDRNKLAGKVTIINFWATWCEACKIELVEMQDEFAELMLNPNFQFVFVSLDKDVEKAKAWVQGHMKQADQYLKYLLQDPIFAAADELGVDAFPMTLVIDQTGKVVKIQRGFKEGENSTKELAKMAGALLKG
jgi:thiol-disulfide isomerase/thioredoxin